MINGLNSHGIYANNQFLIQKINSHILDKKSVNILHVNNKV